MAHAMREEYEGTSRGIKTEMPDPSDWFEDWRSSEQIEDEAARIDSSPTLTHIDPPRTDPEDRRRWLNGEGYLDRKSGKIRFERSKPPPGHADRWTWEEWGDAA
jgi:hypothetical protein